MVGQLIVDDELVMNAGNGIRPAQYEVKPLVSGVSASLLRRMQTATHIFDSPSLAAEELVENVMVPAADVAFVAPMTRDDECVYVISAPLRNEAKTQCAAHEEHIEDQAARRAAREDEAQAAAQQVEAEAAQHEEGGLDFEQ